MSKRVRHSRVAATNHDAAWFGRQSVTLSENAMQNRFAGSPVHSTGACEALMQIKASLRF